MKDIISNMVLLSRVLKDRTVDNAHAPLFHAEEQDRQI